MGYAEFCIGPLITAFHVAHLRRNILLALEDLTHFVAREECAAQDTNVFGVA